ncbi:hypothetical protein [Kineosporia babensis]|uniref:DUF4333 domain-containing protein n=1 Tax=Kineosporia babensis TaxID=499548 RepID=A0A9X1NBX8_9ACTN|nr:hypothetical protein [Kineosporia babensis]MCD5310860.1 hypothetical protein [Kineosporia babensis]
MRFLMVAAVVLLAACSSPGAPSATPEPAAPETTAAARASGKGLARSVQKVIEANGATAKVSCDDYEGIPGPDGGLVGRAGDIVDCTARIEPPGAPTYRTGIRVTWDDNRGHFRTEEQAQ